MLGLFLFEYLIEMSEMIFFLSELVVDSMEILISYDVSLQYRYLGVSIYIAHNA
ncbi:hypothetical protein Q4595_08215 [Wenyingzhuangia sp. 1_MG-2023]|nr:hypothetical protein [Wenyingzhuangia sp. 1_MG-2023]